MPTYAYWTEEKFLEKFRDTYESNERLVPETVTVGSAKALARMACDMNYVTLNSQNLSFTVTGPYDGKTAFVKDDDAGRLICSCEGPGLCFHKEAYLIVTKKNIEVNRTTYKLSTLRKKTRKTKGPSGRKKVAPINVNDVIPAPDSRLAQRETVLEEEDDAMESNIEQVENDDLMTSTPILKRSRLVLDSHCSMNPSAFQDSEDEDDRQGLHFYSEQSFLASTASRASTTGVDSFFLICG